MLNQGFPQPGLPASLAGVSYGHAKGFFLPHDYHQLLSPRDACVDKFALEQSEVLGRQGHDDNRSLASL